MRVGADDWKSPGSLAILASHALPSSFRSRPTPWSVVGRSGDPVRVQPMNRARAATLAFAASVALVIVAVAGVTYWNVQAAFERETANRLTQLAELAASQVAPADVRDAAQLGADGNGLLALQLEALVSAAGLADVTVIDDSSRVVYAVRAGYPHRDGLTAYDSLSHATLVRARAGQRAMFPAFQRAGAERRAVAVPIAEGGGDLLIAEYAPRWGIELDHLRATLALLVAISLLAVAALVVLLQRATTSQWALERRLSRSENLAAMGRMTATLAHEIKNPLAIIRGSARRLGKLAPESQSLADSVVEEVDRLSGTVNRYLEFARGGAPEPGARGDAGATLAATVALLQGEVTANGGALTCTRDAAAEANVALDDASLKQVWLNLIQNALEASPAAGAVHTSCEVVAGRVRVRIVDEGSGIPPEVMARLGEPFLTTRAQGTGLGLYLSKRLVEGVGGSLRVERGPDRGTVVTVEFPVG